MNPNEKFVFWAYDLFPYLLGAPGDQRPNGMYYVPSFQMTVKPVMVCEKRVGEEVHSQLQKLKEQRDDARDALEAGFRLRLRKIAPLALPQR